MYPELSEAERFPMLTPNGRRLLNSMRQHPCAPLWNWPNGEQLDQRGLEKVSAFAKSLQQSIAWHHERPPDWLADHIAFCQATVPFYRRRAKIGESFQEIPTCNRSDLAPKVWDFVPDTVSLDQVIVFSSSGTTGHPTRTPHHPASAASGVPLLEHALRKHLGIELLQGAEHVAITNVAAYPGAFTTAIVIAYLQEAGCIRVNLDSSAWRHSSDCERFINHWKAPIWLGDPIAFGAMQRLRIDHQPQAILSSIMHLTEGFHRKLESDFGCPVLDLYAMTEAGIIAVRTEHGHQVLPNDLHVEILAPDGSNCPLGVRGEITLTGGRNPFLPLLRYRTSDFASLQIIDGERILVGLEGRAPIEYPTRSGKIVHSMQVTRIMRQFPVFHYQLRPPAGVETHSPIATRTPNSSSYTQPTPRCDGVSQYGYLMEYRGDIDAEQLRQALSDLFGESVDVQSMHTS